MKCKTCNIEMEYFEDGKTCGWECKSCGNTIVTTNDDEIYMDESVYSIYILPENTPSAVNIKCIAKIFNCSFIEAKEILISGKELKALNASQTRNIFISLKSSNIHFTTTPEFNQSIYMCR